MVKMTTQWGALRALLKVGRASGHSRLLSEQVFDDAISSSLGD